MLGAKATGDALVLTLTHPRLRWLALVTIAITFALFVGLAVGGWFALPLLLDELGLENRWGRLAAGIALGLLWTLLSVPLGILVAGVVNAPIYEVLSERTERLILGECCTPRFSLLTSIAHAVRELVLQVCLILPVAAVIFAIGLIPGVGQVAGVCLGWAWTSIWVGLEYMMPPVERHGLGLRARVRLVLRNKLLFLGFGSVPALFPWLLVPLCAPAFVVGGTRVFLSLKEHGRLP